jgi:hypothetical protein
LDIKGALTRPLGPLPAWAWGVVIGGGYLLYRYLHTGSLFGSSTSSASSNSAQVEVPASDYGTGATGTGGTSTGGTSSGGTTGGTTDGTTTGGGGLLNPGNWTLPGIGSGGSNTSPSAFVSQFGDTPGNIYTKTANAIYAAGAATPGASLSADKWIALFQQYGGNAGAAAYSVEAGLPAPTENVATGGQGITTAGGGPTGTENSLVNEYFTGVTGTTTSSGYIYQAYQNGTLIGTETSSSPSAGVAFGQSLGLNPNNGWYGPSVASNQLSAPSTTAGNSAAK